MKMLSKKEIRIGIFVVIVLVIIISAFILLTGGSGEKDTTPPEINLINMGNGNFTVKAGETATITVNFTDNVKVVNATLYYRTDGETNWKETSIITGKKELYVPSTTLENWEYYITVNDAANNGPVGKPSTDGSSYYTIIVLENNTNNDEEWNQTRYIFVEEGTAGWCSNCPAVANRIHELFESQAIPFYYATMVDDENNKAHNRLYNDLNIYGFPTVYIDGGYTVIMGSGDFESTFEQRLLDAQARSTQKIGINLTSVWNETRKELENTVILKNEEETTYLGTLKVYITEINSRWTDWNAEAYSYAFIDYGINQDITIPSGETKTVSGIWDANSAGFSDVVKENLFVIAAVFIDESETRYANPVDGENPFDAYFCDASTGRRVEEGILPPSIGINTPREYSHYIRGIEKHNRFLQSTYILGKIPIKVTVTSEADIEKVEFSIQGLFNSFNATDTEEPYEWTWDTFSFGSYTINVKVYDVYGNTDTDSIDVKVFIL